MGKFNTVSKPNQPDTTNFAGGQAYSQDAKTELAALVTTSMVQDQYYRSADDGLSRMRELVSKVDPLFAAKAAVYARNEDGIRSITHAVAGEVINSVKGEEWTKDFISAVVRRPDDATEILAYYMSKYGKPIPTRLKKGLSKALGKFDTYQLAKYRGENREVSLVDLVNIVHPKPTEKNAQALHDLVNGTLKSTDTWETKISAAGKSENVEEAKAEAWKELLGSRKIGYFALLKNLRNIAEQAPELVDTACELLVDENLIRKSLVLPFRFLTALNQLDNYPKYKIALSKALDISLANLPDFGNALVVVDGSGSMQSPVAGNSDLSCNALGAIFAAALYKRNHSDVLVFGDTAGPVRGLNPSDSTLTIANQIMNTNYGYGTNFQSIFESANKNYDNIIIFSDMQAWIGYYTPEAKFKEYRKRTGANPNVFCFDLAGYGTTQFPADKIYELSGFSDKSLSLMEKLKQDKNALVREIEAVTF